MNIDYIDDLDSNLEEIYNPIAELKALKEKNNSDDENVTVVETQIVPPEPRQLRNRTRRQRKNNNPSETTETIVLPDSPLAPCKLNTIFDKNAIELSSESEAEEEENYEVSIKIRWRSRSVVRFAIKRFDTMEKVFEHFVKLEGVSPEYILILLRNKPIKPTDTPASLNITIVDILEGGVTKKKAVLPNDNEADNDICRVKVQSADRKRSLEIPVRRDQKLKTVMFACARHFDVPESKVKLYFDGEELSAKDTPESLDLEEAVCIDIRILK